MRDYTELYDKVNKNTGFAPYNHVVITKVDDNYAEGIVDIVPESLNPVFIVHGGCLTTLADTVTGIAAYTTTAEDEVCVTVNCSMNFLRATSGSRITCKSSMQKAGRTLCIFDATITDDQDRVVATGCFTFFKTKKVATKK